MAYISATLRPAFAERIQGFSLRLREAAARRRLYAATVRELSDLTERDLNDIGVSRMGIAETARKHAYGV